MTEQAAELDEALVALVEPPEQVFAWAAERAVPQVFEPVAEPDESPEPVESQAEVPAEEMVGLQVLAVSLVAEPVVGSVE